MSFMRIASGGFFTKWSRYSREEKLSNKEFQRALSHLKSNQCSVFKGDGSEEFSRRIAATFCIATGRVEKKEVFVFRIPDGCIMIIEEYGTIGIDSVDRYHYDLGDISQDELLDIFDSVVKNDIHLVTKDHIFQILVQFEREDSSLRSRYASKFSSDTLRRLEGLGGGSY